MSKDMFLNQQSLLPKRSSKAVKDDFETQETFPKKTSSFIEEQCC
jgi:hypothetical protein